jgi:hypothetical protein
LRRGSRSRAAIHPAMLSAPHATAAMDIGAIDHGRTTISSTKQKRAARCRAGAAGDVSGLSSTSRAGCGCDVRPSRGSCGSAAAKEKCGFIPGTRGVVCSVRDKRRAHVRELPHLNEERAEGTTSSPASDCSQLCRRTRPRPRCYPPGWSRCSSRLQATSFTTLQRLSVFSRMVSRSVQRPANGRYTAALLPRNH